MKDTEMRASSLMLFYHAERKNIFFLHYMDETLVILALFIISSIVCSLIMVSALFAVQIPRQQQQTAVKQKHPRKTSSTSAPPSIGYELLGLKTDCPPGRRGVVAYENQFRDGRGYMFCRSDGGKGPGMSEMRNDKVSYLSVPFGMKATVYEHQDFKGLSKSFGMGEFDLHQETYDGKRLIKDSLSAIKIEGYPPEVAKGSSEYSDQNRWSVTEVKT